MRRRSIAITLVLCTGLVSIAYGDFVTTTNPSNAGFGRTGTTMRTILSIRNTATDPKTATISPLPAITGPCMGMSLTDINGTSQSLWMFDAGEQRQYIVSGNFATTGTRSCDWTIDDGGSSSSFTTVFDVGSGSGAGLNVTPSAFMFQVPGTSETQTGYVQNYGTIQNSYASVTINDGNTNVLAFDGGTCNGMKQCAGTTIAAGSFQALGFKCTPQSTPVNGTITYMLGASAMLTQMFTCQRSGMPPVIDITQPSLTLQGAAGGTVMATANVTGAADSIESATIVGADATAFQLVAPAPPCAGQACTFSPAMPLGTGITLTVQCTPGTTQKTAQLKVKGTAHATDVDVADLTCVADSGASTSPSQLDFGDVKVTDTSAPLSFMIHNLSSTAPTSVTIDTGHPDWIASSCVAQACPIAAGGTIAVDVRFKPSVPAQNNRTLGVFVGATRVASVDLIGNGVGSKLRVTSNQAPYLIDFGTIGLATNRTRTVTLKADGNRSLNVAIGSPASPPFTVSKPALDLAPGAEDMFDVSCQSSTAGTFDSAVTLMAGPPDHVYAADTPKLDVHCKVANTPIQVSPDELDFGEVRKNTPPPTITVTISNPSAQTISLDYVKLQSASGPVAIAAPNVTSLGPSEMVTASLTLATTAEATIQNSLLVGVGGEELVTPITGSVVTASARVTPTSLRLGSVCINTQVDEPVKLVNNGTARLHAQPPVMDDPFAVLFTNPVNYPEGGALLAPLEEATASVRLATSTPGPVTGKLTWDVDAPDAPFTIEASLEIKNAGTAVSPQALGFDQLPVMERSDRRTIRLENCGTVPSRLVIRGVVSSRGSVGAWEVMPSTLDTMLQPAEKRTIEVTFAPKRTGVYLAAIVLEVDGVMQSIELTGEAIGNDVNRESLYACSCEVPGSPLAGAPIVIVIVCVMLPRRRRR